MSKFKVGDKVKILDGSNIENYTGTWVSRMYKHIGEIHVIESVSNHSNGTVAYLLEDVECIWDERGLELVTKFKVGDKVIGNKDASAAYGYTKEGWIGTVIKVYDKPYCGNDFRAVGIGPNGNQEFGLNSKFFDLYNEHATQKIVITTDGKTTTAVLYDGKKRIKDAKAICSPDDTFDFGIGSALAIERLLGNPKATLPEDEKFEEVIEEGFLNARICIINGHSSSQFKAGEIYNIKEGKILDTPFPYDGRIKDFDDLKYYFCSDSKRDELKHSENLGHHCFDGVEYKVLSSLDWNKFAHGKLEVKVSRKKFDEFMKLCEERNFAFFDMPATKGNPWKLFDKLPEFYKVFVKTIGGEPSKYVYVSTDKDGNLQWDNDHDKDIDEYEFV